MSRVRPFLKWAGGKYQIVDRIKAMLPPGRRLVEPFAGSAALFLNTGFSEYLLADSNADLISLYRTLQNEGPGFIEYCSSFFTHDNNTAGCYYRFRDDFNNACDSRYKAALFVYLNRHGYNGLCRYNSRGRFNTPFGRYSRPYFPGKEMDFFYGKSKKAVFQTADFRQVLRETKTGDVVYCDPPYVPLSGSANFTAYSAGGFSNDDQEELAAMARMLACRGVPVLISNHATRFTLEAYKPARLELFPVQRYISSDGTNRGKAVEVLALFI